MGCIVWTSAGVKIAYPHPDLVDASMSSPTSLYLDQEDLTRRLLDLTNRTGYEILQKHGQRMYGGPPPGWTGPQPDKGTEVYCYRIPRDCFEDELVPVFSSAGQIYELRLMIEFSGTNRCATALQNTGGGKGGN